MVNLRGIETSSREKNLFLYRQSSVLAAFMLLAGL